MKTVYKSFLVLLASMFLLSHCKSAADQEAERVKDLSSKLQCDLAIDLATEAIKKYPDDPRFFYERGFCYYRDNKYKTALKDFSGAIGIDPKYANGYYGMATVYLEQNKYSLAEKNFNKAINLAPNDDRKSLFTLSLSDVYSYQENYEKAIDIINQAIKIEDSSSSRGYLGYAYYDKGDKKEALVHFMKALELDNYDMPDHKGWDNYNLADILYEMEDYKQAMPYAEQAMEILPNEKEVNEIYTKIEKKL